MNQDQFAQDSKDLMNVLLQRAKELVDGVDTLERPSEDTTSYYGYLKDFPINSGCLCDDILRAAHNDAVLLAMSGVRVLLEDTINVHYLESRPDAAARIAVAIDWFKISNDTNAQKHELDGKNVASRAKEAGKAARALYYGEYADFCNYIHSTAARALLNVPSHRIILANKAVVASLKAYANIVTCTERLVGESTSATVTAAATSYFDKYRQTVMEVSLPLLDDTGKVIE
ncbi:MAG TPA: hypothetical protein VLF91_04185 [Candidatus Saccharimonadales bacterium]|nr:hypothetical protein [Candidatus Saccharimonadales bacterium]